MTIANEYSAYRVSVDASSLFDSCSPLSLVLVHTDAMRVARKLITSSRIY